MAALLHRIAVATEFPTLRSTLRDEDGPIDLANVVTDGVKLTIERDGATVLGNAIGTIEDSATGKVYYTFTDTDLLVPGIHIGRWELEFSTGSIFSPRFAIDVDGN